MARATQTRRTVTIIRRNTRRTRIVKVVRLSSKKKKK